MRIPVLILVLLQLAACGEAPVAREPLPHASAEHVMRVLTLNVQLDGHDQLRQIGELIRIANADVVFLQECGADKCGAPLAQMLGLKHLQQGDDTATLSRWPIDPDGRVTTPWGTTVRVRNLHLGYTPYQPYQLLKIPYEQSRFISTEAEAIVEANAVRAKEVSAALAALVGDPLVIAGGDFNEPSCLDWTDAAVAAKLQPLKVAWPSTKAFGDAGFSDAYRAVYPDPVARPGLTWTPTTRRDDPKDHHDRIDFLFERGLVPRSAQVIGENAENADIVVSPYPTDHRGVVAMFALPATR